MTNAMPSRDRLTVGAGLIAIAEAIMHNLLVLPQKVELTLHDLNRQNFLMLADQYEVPIHMTAVAAWITVPLATPERNGIEVEYTMYASDKSEAAIEAYSTHNDECLTDPEAAAPPRIDLPELTRRLGLLDHEQSAVQAYTGDPYGTTWTEEEAASIIEAWQSPQAEAASILEAWRSPGSNGAL